MTKAVIQDIACNATELIKQITSDIKKQLKSEIPPIYHNTIDNIIKDDLRHSSQTDFKRIKYLKNNSYFIEPIKFEIGSIVHYQKKTILVFLQRRNLSVTVWI